MASSDGLRRAVRRNRVFSREGLLESLFIWAFKGLVYPQIWEDPDVDLKALAIGPDCHVVAIASGGCNILSYLIANPARITAVDLSKAHVALNRLKLAAAIHLPSWDAFFRFFGDADEKANIDAYWRWVAPHLDPQTRAYWEGRSMLAVGRRRISMFSRNIFRHGVLGHFIGLGHLVARAYGVNLGDVLRAQSVDEQRSFFNTAVAPLFDKRFVRWAIGRQLSLYGLGIPPAQYAALAAAGDITSVLRERMERLTCAFSLAENYFAWQAFARCYPDRESGPVPPYLHRAHFDTIRARADRVEVCRTSLTEYLEGRPERSLDRFVLLDAQDWMTDAQLNALWREISRTARPSARVVFRTAAASSILPGRVEKMVLERWRYEVDESAMLTACDRSAIYGGFHLYVLED